MQMSRQLGFHTEHGRFLFLRLILLAVISDYSPGPSIPRRPCQLCFNSQMSSVILGYSSGRMPWNYPYCPLIPLC